MRCVPILLCCIVSVVPAMAASPVARLNDTSAHGGSIVVGSPNVLVNGLPAARVGDMHVCPMVTNLVPHVGGPVASGSATVFVNGLPIAVVGSTAICTGPPDMIAIGSINVNANNQFIFPKLSPEVGELSLLPDPVESSVDTASSREHGPDFTPLFCTTFERSP